MCELFAMSALQPAEVSFSLEESSRHGELSGPHEDGRGIAFYQNCDARIFREPLPAASSAYVRFIEIMLAQIDTPTDAPISARMRNHRLREKCKKSQRVSLRSQLAALFAGLRLNRQPIQLRLISRLARTLAAVVSMLPALRPVRTRTHHRILPDIIVGPVKGKPIDAPRFLHCLEGRQGGLDDGILKVFVVRLSRRMA